MPEITPTGSLAAKCVTADALISSRPCLLYGAIMTVSADGAYCDIYEGQDADSGQLLFRVKTTANATRSVKAAPPIYCSRGIYVDVGDDVTYLSILFAPLPLSQQ